MLMAAFFEVSISEFQVVLWYGVNAYRMVSILFVVITILFYTQILVADWRRASWGESMV